MERVAFLGEELGRGAFGSVRLAEYRSLKVAVKSLTKEAFSEMMREASLLARVSSHPNITRFFGVCSEDGHECIVIEYAPSGSLEDALCGRENKIRFSGPKVLKH